MSYFKSGYFTPQYYNKYWQAEGAGDTARLDVNAVATVSFVSVAPQDAALIADGVADVLWNGQGGLPIEPERPPQVIGGGAAASVSRPLLRPWEAFEPTILRARATVTGTALVEATAYDAELRAKIAAQNARDAEIDEDDQFVLSFVTAFLSEQNGCEINGIVS